MKNKKILVTGCAGDIGFSIGKLLKKEQFSHVIGCDIHNNHAGIVLFNSAEVIAPVSSGNLIQDLVYIVKKYNIDIIISTVEAELRFFTKNKIEEIGGALLLMSDYGTRTIGFNKYLTAHFLKESNLPYPWTNYVEEGYPKELPCIIKNIFGAGSKDVHYVDHSTVEYYAKMTENMIWQELLLPDDEEYTCGLYRSKLGEIRNIIFKRKLLNGITGSGSLIKNVQIEQLLTQLAEAIGLEGSINVQLRLTSKGPIIFEINPRFSSTVLFRHLLGFTDLLWSLEELVFKKISPYKEKIEDIDFYKVFDEVIIYK